MNKIKTAGFLITCCFLMTAGPGETDRQTLNGIFPEISGFQKKGTPEIYEPANLYEYINGAAEVYLSYDFQELTTLSYDNKNNQSITIDIYRHSNPETGFGIYSQEKPADGDFIEIGTQGYYEQGVLNFFKDRYYVKLNGFDLQDQDRALLERTASRIDEKLAGNPVFPPVLSCFPDRGKIKNSERYILQNFLGHSFLHSAFVCDYRTEKQPVQVFIIQAESEAEARRILDDYAGFLEKRGLAFQRHGQDSYRFQDPYYRSRGHLNLIKKDRFIWGLFSDNPEFYRYHLDSIEQNLKSRKLIQ